jgi:gluconokinase
MTPNERAPTRGRADLLLPSVLILMGVSGSRKSTIGTLLAGRRQWDFQDGDWFHPAANVDKMHSGIPLTGLGWTRSQPGSIRRRGAGRHGVIACSMLKRRYREVLVGDRADVRLIYLNGDETLIARRLAAHDEHFMPARLLHGDFVALEGPGRRESDHHRD